MSIADEPAIEVGRLDRLMAQLGGDPEDLKRLLGAFLSNGARLVATMQTAAGADAKAVEDAAHTLKSSSGWIGAQRLAGLCMRIEARARDVSAGERVILINALALEHARVQRAVEEVLAGLA